MLKPSSPFKLLAAAVLCIAAASATRAQATLHRAFVSTHGDDANSCLASAPCRSFGTALTKLLPGGEIVVLDSGGYGAVTINQAVTIEAIGVRASITAGAGNDAITVAAGGADAVVLRGLTMNNGQNGITFASGGSLYVEDCEIQGFSGHGINFNAAGKLIVGRTHVRKCGLDGVFISAPSGQALAYIHNSLLSDCGNAGVEASGNSRVSVAYSSAVNSFIGFISDTSGGHNSDMVLDHARAVNNGTGIEATAGNGGGMTTLYFGYSVATQNGTGITVGPGGTIKGSNPGTSLVSENGIDTSGTLGFAVGLQ